MPTAVRSGARGTSSPSGRWPRVGRCPTGSQSPEPPCEGMSYGGAGRRHVSRTAVVDARSTTRGSRMDEVPRMQPAVDDMPSVSVAVLQLDPDLPLPTYAHLGDAGADLYAAATAQIPPGGRAVVPTGVAIELPPGYVGLIHPRSGLAAKLGVTVLNAPGTVDSGYRGELMVILVNHDPIATACISRGDRIAQLVVQRVERAHFHLVDVLDETARGDGRHGSTGGHDGMTVRVARARRADHDR